MSKKFQPTCAVMLAVSWPQPVLANGGLPVLTLFGENQLVIGLVLIVAMEALIVRHMATVQLWPALIALSVGNLMSFLAGFPVTFIFSLVVIDLATGPNSESFASPLWALLFLAVYFAAQFLVSWWVEVRICANLLTRERKELSRPLLVANAVTYTLLAIFTAINLVGKD